MILPGFMGGLLLGGQAGGGGEPSPDPLLDATFASDDEGFSSGAYTASEGWQFEDGYLALGTSETSTRSFTAQTTGTHRVDFHLRITDATASSDAAHATTLYVLPTSGSVDAANSLACIQITKNLAHYLQVNLLHDDTSTSDTAQIARGGWLKLSIVLDFDAKTWDFYIQDVLWLRALGSNNELAADMARVALVNGSAATADFDSIRVEAGWTSPAEAVVLQDDFTLGTGAIEASTPDTDAVNVYAQPWNVPTGSGYCGFTRTASGLQAASSGDRASAWYRCVPEGVFEATFTASVTSASLDGAISIRSYPGDGASDGNVVFRLRDSSGRLASIEFDGSIADSGALSGTTVTAGTDYTLKIIARGRYFWCYVNDTLQFGGPVVQESPLDRGSLPEDAIGPMVLNGVTDNYVKSLTVTGRVSWPKKQKTIGEWTWVLEPASVRECYNSEVALPQRDLLISQGWQFAHIAEHDISPFDAEVETVYDTDNLLVQRQRGILLSERRGAGVADCYITLSRNSIWTEDSVFIAETAFTFGPDFDLRPDLWDTNFRYIGDSGASSAGDITTASFNTFLTDTLPVGHQNITTPASGDSVRLTNVAKAISANRTMSIIAAKISLTGGQNSYGVRETTADLTAGETITIGYRALFERGAALALSDAVLQDARDEIASPGSLAMHTGTIKTDADGDTDSDGFNERFGWYEVDCASGVASFTIPASSVSRYYPQIRLNNYTASLTFESSSGALTAGVDYVLDDLGDGNALVQILSVLTATEGYGYGTDAPESDAQWSDVLLLVRAGTTDDLSPVGRSLTWGASITDDGTEITMPGETGGDNGVIKSPDAADLTFPGPFCIEIFGAKFDNATAQHTLVSHWRAASGSRSWLSVFRGNVSPKLLGLYTTADGTSSTFRGDDFTPTVGTAYDICIEADGTDLRVFVDGVMIHKEAWAVSLNNSPARLLIGSSETSGGTAAGADSWQGAFKSMRITDAARYGADTDYTVPSLPLPTL